MKRTGQIKITVIAAGFALGLLGMPPQPASAGEIGQRQAAMEDMDAAFKILVAIIKGEAAFDGKIVARAGYSMANNLIAAGGLFPPGSEAANSRARPEIWQDMGHFKKDLATSLAAAQKVAEAGEAGDADAFRAAFGPLGNSCKGCHEHFRKPKS